MASASNVFALPPKTNLFTGLPAADLQICGALEQAGALARRIDRVFCDPAKLAETARSDDA